MSESPGCSVSVYAIIRDKARVLLVQDRYRPGWKLPGGLVGPGELIGDALRREVKEEVNLEIRPKRLLLVSNWIKKGVALARVRVYIIADRSRGELSFNDREVVAGRWFTRPELGRLKKNDFLLPQHYFAAMKLFLSTPGAGIRLRRPPKAARHDITFQE